MARTETIRGLERGLRVLQALQASPISSLHSIYLATRISKPSLLRILHTLEQFGMVSRRLADGHYRVSSFARPARKRDRFDRVAEAAAPVLDRLYEKVSWPSDLFVPAGDHMEQRETSRMHNPHFSPAQVARIGQPVNWLMTGVGRAYLAFCPDREREAILQRLRKSDYPEDRIARDREQVDRVLAETRAKGYATRAPNFLGGPYGSFSQDDGLSGMAVPLLDRARVYGSINILWIRTAMTAEQCAARHLADLKAAAVEIVESLQRPARR